MTHPFAKFHYEIFNILEDNNNQLFGLMAFRGSGKSSIVTTAYSIWSILGVQKKKFVVIVCKNKDQAKMHMKNLKIELEENKLLKRDLGPFQQDTNEWSNESIYLPNYDAKIIICSTEQSIRGMRFKNIRPEVIILDDVEDWQSTQTKESRVKLKTWFASEIVPLGDLNTRIIILGNMLHRDALLSSIEEQVKLDGNRKVFKRYPLIENDVCLWPEKFDTDEKIQSLKNLVNNTVVWEREYLLLEKYTGQQLIKPDQIKYYENIPFHKRSDRNIYRISMGVDLATSESEFADYTAGVMVLELEIDEGEYSYYVLPSMMHMKGSYLQIVKNLEELVMVTQAKFNRSIEIQIENVGMQNMVIQAVRYYSGFTLNINDYKPCGSKLDRLYMVSALFEKGQVFFPKLGAEDLVNEILGFPNEKHDDLMDAFTSAIIPIVANRASSYVICV